MGENVGLASGAGLAGTRLDGKAALQGMKQLSRLLQTEIGVNFVDSVDFRVTRFLSGTPALFRKSEVHTPSSTGRRTEE